MTTDVRMPWITRGLGIAAAAAVMAGTSGSAAANGFSFDVSFFKLSANSALYDIGSGGDNQLKATVADEGSDQVSFTFFNFGSTQSTVARIYFDDGSLLGIATVDNFGGADFEPASPPGPSDLPGGNLASPPFETTAEFYANAQADPPDKGLLNTRDDSVKITFDIINSKTFSDVQSELQSGEVRIGLHVINLADGESDAYINNPPNGDQPPPPPGVPEPASLLLFGAGLVTMGIVRRRRQTTA